MRSWMIIVVLLVLGQATYSQQSLLQSGPMLGPVTLRDATLWVQTKEDAKVRFDYRVKGIKSSYTLSETVVTKKDDGHTASVHLSELMPGTVYEYRTYINEKILTFGYPTEFKTQAHWQYRSDPPDFSFIAGSCFYVNEPSYDRPGKPYGGEYEIIKHMYDSKPDFMVWLGDNTYLREGDFESRAGIYHRQSHTRSFPALQSFLASQPHYAIWDDHDYGPNDSDWTYELKQHSLDAFRDFWPSESYGAGHTEGVTSSFKWNDCQFFMLDDRWYRTVDKENGTILGEQQKYWLKEALLSSEASFKFVAVGGQFLSDFVGYENFANYNAEREEIIQFLDDNDIKGVIFLTGDRHHSEISRLQTAKGNIYYDVTSSAITSGTTDHSSEPNTLRVPGSMIGIRNFAVFSVNGDKKNRQLSVLFKNSEGKEVGKYEFRN